MTGPPVVPVLKVSGLSFGYPQQPALFTDWSTRAPPGITLVRGGESKGKTTLLRLLAGDLKAHAGQIQVNGVALSGQSDAYLQQVFWTDPRSDAFNQINALDYLASLRAHYPAFEQPAVESLLDGLSLTEHQLKPLYMLSTGSRRKVWLAAAFASGAALTLLDDPFAALDKASIGFVMDRLKNEAAKRNTARAWLIADYAAPGPVPLAAVIDLGN